MSNLHWVLGVALTFTLAVSACSSDDTTSSGPPGEAGAAGEAGHAAGGAAGATPGGDAGGALGEPEGGAAGAAGAPVVLATCLPAGDIAVSAEGLTYVIGGVADPELTLCRGSKYTFVLGATISTPIEHPFYVKTTLTSGTADAFTEGVTGNGNTTGSVVFTVPADAPDTLYYHCSVHTLMGGKLTIVD